MSFSHTDLPDDMLKSAESCVLSSQTANIKEETAILSLLAEKNPKDIDDFVQRSAEENFGIQANNFNVESSANFAESVGLSPDHSCSSDSNFGYHSESDRSSSCSFDPDYDPYSPEVERKMPKAVENTRTAARKETKSRSVSSSRAGKPYARKVPGVPIEDKKLRKKEQNKNAATRYRIKKKAEIEVILGEESELQDKNDELKKSVEDLNREIKFMKKFMRDFFKTEGLLK